MTRSAAESAAALVADYYAAFNRGDRAAMLALLAEDVAHDLNQGAREVGRAAFAAFMAHGMVPPARPASFASLRQPNASSSARPNVKSGAAQ